jgi:hypothetical protein
LQADRHFSDLVQEKRPAMGLLKSPGAVMDGASKSPAHMPEKLRFEQALRKGAAVDRYERVSPAGCVNRSGYHFFSRARLSLDQYGAAAFGDKPDNLADPADCPAFADD